MPRWRQTDAAPAAVDVQPVRIKPDEPNALRVAPDRRDAVDRHADELAAVGDEYEIVVVGDEAEGNDLAVAFGRLDRGDALAAAVLRRIVRRGRALAVAALAHREQRRGLLARQHGHADDLLVGVAQADPPHAARLAAQGADVLVLEANV